MKAITLGAVSLLALGASACSHRDTHSAAATGRLDCPIESGALKRVSAAPDGKSCEYEIADGAQVSLKLMPVDASGASGLLSRLEADLKAETMDAKAQVAKPEDGAKVKDTVATATADAAKAIDKAAASDKAWSASDSAEDASASEIERRVDDKLRERGLSTDNKSAHVVMPGVRVDADEANDSAHVSLPGVHIDAEGNGAAIRVGPLHIDTDSEKAVVKATTDVRLRGEGLERTKRGLQAMFVYAGDNLGGGYKYVGYEAAGPKTGPLTVAIIRSRKDGGFHGDVYGDVKRLVRRNGGI